MFGLILLAAAVAVCVMAVAVLVGAHRAAAEPDPDLIGGVLDEEVDVGPAGTDAALERVEDYANGGRRIAVVSARAAAELDPAAVALVELALDGALSRLDLPVRAEVLRSYEGLALGRRLCGWQIPAPFGADVADVLTEAVDALNHPRSQVITDH